MCFRKSQEPELLSDTRDRSMECYVKKNQEPELLSDTKDTVGAWTVMCLLNWCLIQEVRTWTVKCFRKSQEPERLSDARDRSLTWTVMCFKKAGA
jgi:hypothetical protein